MVFGASADICDGSPSIDLLLIDKLLLQWEYQIGPCSGTDASDQLIVSRYILSRVAEQFGVKVAMVEPDVVRKSKVHNALHTNFSTNVTRCEGGLA